MLRLFTPAATMAADMTVILSYLPLMAVAVVAATPLGRNLVNARKDSLGIRIAGIAGAALLMLLCTAALASQSYNPFIYFRF